MARYYECLDGNSTASLSERAVAAELSVMKTCLRIVVSVIAVAASISVLWPAFEKQVAYRVSPSVDSSIDCKNVATLSPADAAKTLATNPLDAAEAAAKNANAAPPDTTAQDCARAQVWAQQSLRKSWGKVLQVEVWVVALAIAGLVLIGGLKTTKMPG